MELPVLQESEVRAAPGEERLMHFPPISHLPGIADAGDKNDTDSGSLHCLGPNLFENYIK